MIVLKVIFGLFVLAFIVSSIGSYLDDRPRPRRIHHTYNRAEVEYAACILLNLCRASLANERGMIPLPLNFTRRTYTPFELEKVRRRLNAQLATGKLTPEVLRVHQHQNYFIIRLAV